MSEARNKGESVIRRGRVEGPGADAHGRQPIEDDLEANVTEYGEGTRVVSTKCPTCGLVLAVSEESGGFDEATARPAFHQLRRALGFKFVLHRRTAHPSRPEQGSQ